MVARPTKGLTLGQWDNGHGRPTMHVIGQTTAVGVVQGHFPALPDSCLVAVLTRPSGSALWVSEEPPADPSDPRPGDVDVEVLDVDVDLVRRRGRRLRSPDCPG